MKENVKKTALKDGFGSSFGVLMALAGSAVGLGNLWRFPYLVGENGGAAFIIIYLAFVFAIGLPIMLAEFVIGRRSQSNAIGAFKKLAPGTLWWLVGVVAVVCCASILSFYCVVGGWSIDYLLKACTFSFTKGGSDEALSAMFGEFVSSPIKPLIFHTIFLLATGAIVVAGVKKGIEKFSKIMMPALFFIIILIAIRSLTLKGAEAGISYLFKPDFSKVTSSTLIAALGQAFFSLSIGSGMVITYGAYAPKNDNMLRTSAGTVTMDTLFAIIAGCAIMPAVFAFGIDPSAGPGLVFVTLPHIFSQMPLGGAIAILFFLTLLLAALTSSISLMEVVIAFGIGELKMKRRTATILAIAILWVLGCLCSLSQGVLSDVKLFGMNIFDFFDYVSANILMLFGGMAVVIFAGWKLGRKVIREELTNNGTIKVPKWLSETLTLLIRFVAPAAIAVIAVC